MIIKGKNKKTNEGDLIIKAHALSHLHTVIGLRFIHEKCAALGQTPLQWKMSKIIPLFKKVIL